MTKCGADDDRLLTAAVVALWCLFVCAAIALWTATGDEDHIWIVGSYFHYSVPGGFDAPAAKDITPKGGLFGKSDPMYVVMARKAADSSTPPEQSA
jgi:hypothetical protein